MADQNAKDRRPQKKRKLVGELPSNLFAGVLSGVASDVIIVDSGTRVLQLAINQQSVESYVCGGSPEPSLTVMHVYQYGSLAAFARQEAAAQQSGEEQQAALGQGQQAQGHAGGQQRQQPGQVQGQQGQAAGQQEQAAGQQGQGVPGRKRPKKGMLPLGLTKFLQLLHTHPRGLYFGCHLSQDVSSGVLEPVAYVQLLGDRQLYTYNVSAEGNAQLLALGDRPLQVEGRSLDREACKELLVTGALIIDTDSSSSGDVQMTDVRPAPAGPHVQPGLQAAAAAAGSGAGTSAQMSTQVPTPLPFSSVSCLRWGDCIPTNPRYAVFAAAMHDWGQHHAPPEAGPQATAAAQNAPEQGNGAGQETAAAAAAAAAGPSISGPGGGPGAAWGSGAAHGGSNPLHMGGSGGGAGARGFGGFGPAAPGVGSNSGQDYMMMGTLVSLASSMERVASSMERVACSMERMEGRMDRVANELAKLSAQLPASVKR